MSLKNNNKKKKNGVEINDLFLHFLIKKRNNYFWNSFNLNSLKNTYVSNGKYILSWVLFSLCFVLFWFFFTWLVIK